MRSVWIPLLITGCVVVHEPVNRPPIVLSAAAWCAPDAVTGELVWTFDAEVTDPDGPYDVVEVNAYVYDEFSGWEVDRFALDPSADPYWWSSSWWEADTWLRCSLAWTYVVDVVAWDTTDTWDRVSVLPQAL